MVWNELPLYCRRSWSFLWEYGFECSAFDSFLSCSFPMKSVSTALNVSKSRLYIVFNAAQATKCLNGSNSPLCASLCAWSRSLFGFCALLLVLSLAHTVSRSSRHFVTCFAKRYKVGPRSKSPEFGVFLVFGSRYCEEPRRTQQYSHPDTRVGAVLRFCGLIFFTFAADPAAWFSFCGFAVLHFPAAVSKD